MTLKLEFMRELEQYSRTDYLLRYLTYAASPVLTGAKAAELITIKPGQKISRQCWLMKRDEILADFGLECREFSVVKNSITLLLYDRVKLTAAVYGTKGRKILKRFGYPKNADLEVIFKHLQDRFYTDEFPHEIGLFLGFPPDDVHSFIEKGGKDYCYCRYWKVYHDIDDSLKRFERIDRAKSSALSLLMTAKRPIGQVVMRLKALCY